MITLIGVVPADSASAGTVDVSADGETYLVDGAVIHHSRFENDRTEAATCTTCHWRIHLICRTWSDTAHGACPSLARGCPASESVAEVERAEALQRPPADSNLWHLVGHSCIGDGGPASVILIRQQLRQRWRIPIPPLRVTTSPPNTTLKNLPTQIEFLSPQSLPDKTQILVGIPVTFRATSQRHVMCNPNCQVDQMQKSFVSVVPGHHVLTVTAGWTATYDALGLTNLPTNLRPIVQRRSLSLDVVEIHRSLLAAPRS